MTRVPLFFSVPGTILAIFSMSSLINYPQFLLVNFYINPLFFVTQHQEVANMALRRLMFQNLSKSGQPLNSECRAITPRIQRLTKTARTDPFPGLARTLWPDMTQIVTSTKDMALKTVLLNGLRQCWNIAAPWCHSTPGGRKYKLGAWPKKWASAHVPSWHV